MVREPQDVRIAARLTQLEADMLEELTVHFGLNTTDTLRQMIRREHAKEIGKKMGSPPAKPRTVKPKK